ncbi:MAG TPA: family 16 glycosylhydrolase [Cellvibrio sp.]|nr:family 16 glycosylhydrolase [Cellvibrio sp.]
MTIHEYGFKPKLLSLCLSVALTSLVGCGGSDGGGNNNSSAAASTVPSSVAPSSLAASSVTPSSTAPSSIALSSVAFSSASSEQASSSSLSSAGPKWELVWSDEFNGTVVDTTKWQYEKNCWGGGNNEQQCYTDRAVNSFVADGYLNIVAKREDFTGSDSAEGESPTTKTLPYTSARLRTKNIQEWTFGRFEIRAKLPFGQGTWPAIWMLPTNSPYGGWAGGGEIDIMEAVNLKTVTDDNPPEANVHGTLHFGRAAPGNVYSGAAYQLPNNASPADDFHVYSVEWEEGEIRWYVDDVHFATQRDTGWYSQYMQDGTLKDAPIGAPFDRFSKFHLLLNLAVGGNWAGTVNNKGVDETVFPQTMLVDYVRVYQCSGSALTGKGCATIGENPKVVSGHQRPLIGKVDLPDPPLFLMYDNGLDSHLRYNSYNPDGVVSYTHTQESGRGEILNVIKTGANGNVYFQVAGDSADMRNWATTSELIFDVRVNSKADNAKLLVKIDSGWPDVSDVEVPLAAVGEWKEFRITLADLLDNGNSFDPGKKATLASIANTFVIDPIGAMNVSFDNIRIAGTASTEPGQFAQLPLFTVYDDSLASGVDLLSHNPNGHITLSTVTEDGYGSLIKLVKNGAVGNIFFNVKDGPVDLTHWSGKGDLVFNYKINSKANDTTVLIKMDSGWPKVSDVSITPLPADGVWSEFRIDIADLIDNGNSISCCPGVAELDAITNIFVIEPSGAIDMVIDKVRLEEK